MPDFPTIAKVETFIPGKGGDGGDYHRQKVRSSRPPSDLGITTAVLVPGAMCRPSRCRKLTKEHLLTTGGSLDHRYTHLEPYERLRKVPSLAYELGNRSSRFHRRQDYFHRWQGVRSMFL